MKDRYHKFIYALQDNSIGPAADTPLNLQSSTTKLPSVLQRQVNPLSSDDSLITAPIQTENITSTPVNFPSTMIENSDESYSAFTAFLASPNITTSTLNADVQTSQLSNDHGVARTDKTTGFSSNNITYDNDTCANSGFSVTSYKTPTIQASLSEASSLDDLCSNHSPLTDEDSHSHISNLYKAYSGCTNYGSKVLEANQEASCLSQFLADIRTEQPARIHSFGCVLSPKAKILKEASLDTLNEICRSLQMPSGAYHRASKIIEVAIGSGLLTARTAKVGLKSSH